MRISDWSSDVCSSDLGLPDRDYYFRTDAKSKALRTQYVTHIQNMFELLGEPASSAGVHAATVMKMETALAKPQLSRVERRDPYQLDHKMNARDLHKLMTQFDWSTYLQVRDLSGYDHFNAEEPKYYRALDKETRRAQDRHTGNNE